jgi:hypothetical protein
MFNEQKALGDRPLLSLAKTRYARKYLAALGARAPRNWSASIIERGRMLLEQTQNDAGGDQGPGDP